MSEGAFKVNKQFYECLQSKKPILIHVGGSRSSKSFCIAQYLIYLCQCEPAQRAKYLGVEVDKVENLKITVVRAWRPRLTATIYQDFLDILNMWGLYDEKHHNKTTLGYNLNGCTINFIAVGGEPQSLRGLATDICFINEANELTKEEYKQLNMRTRIKVICDYNPSMDSHWLYDIEDDENIETDVFYSTYKDNAFLPERQRQAIEDLKHTDPESYKIYALGKRASKLKGRIFKTWQQVNELPEGAIFWGLDFGYTQDPTALVKCVKIDNELYAQECMYQTRAEAKDISAALIRNGYYSDPVYCDHNQPIVVEELRRMGINAIKAKKGNNSVMEGIEAMKRIKIFVTYDSENLWSEFQKYSYKLKRGGDPDSDADWLNEPEDRNNHCFVEGTTIDTSKGFRCIEDIREGDLVRTKNGYNKVLSKFNNGLRPTKLYLIQLDTHLVYLHCTKDHKIWTSQGWIEIQNLRKGMTMCLLLNSTGKDTIYTKVKSITVKEQTDSIEWYLNTIKAKYQKVMMYTTLMRIQPITGSKILLWLNVLYTLDLLASKGLRIIQSGLRNFTRRVSKKQRNGISQKREENGIDNTERTVGETKSIQSSTVKFVEKNMKHHSQADQNTVTTTAKQKLSEKGDVRNVYDLMIEDNHEYFANGVLVHNCVDSLRYAYTSHFKTGKENFFVI